MEGWTALLVAGDVHFSVETTSIDEAMTIESIPPHRRHLRLRRRHLHSVVAVATELLLLMLSLATKTNVGFRMSVDRTIHVEQIQNPEKDRVASTEMMLQVVVVGDFFPLC